MEDSHNYMTEEMLDKLGFVRINYGDYGRKTVKEVCVDIHGIVFLVDFIVIGYANECEPSVIFGRDFLVTTKSKVDFEERDLDALLVELVKTMEEVGSSSGELMKMRKASRNKGHYLNKVTPLPPLKIEEIPSLSLITPQPEDNGGDWEVNEENKERDDDIISTKSVEVVVETIVDKWER
uniref:Uncharacterized protein n=1 Tax=Tanacetum cinerariifolium TaxID=118510 RepID=A0A6L2P9K8_TANCI|nr:hypothetical protein [Tanacetum cinerariifolium]